MDSGPSSSDPDFQIPRPEIDPSQVRRAVRVGSIIAGIIFLFTFSASALVPYTDFLWYKFDAREPEVFLRMYGARGSLFALSFLATWALFAVNLGTAFKVSLIFLRAPENRGQVLLSNTMDFVRSRGPRLVRILAPALAFFSALGFSSEWNTWLLARNAEPFGMVDPTFGLDLGFFVFKLPWYRAVANYSVAVLFITVLATLGIYAGLQALAALAKIELGRPQVRAHIGLLVATLLLAYGAQVWLKLYEAGLGDSAQFTGVGYAGLQTVGAQRMFALLLVGIAILVAINGWRGKPFRAMPTGAFVLFAWYVGGVMVYPGFIQRVQVDPDRLTKEAPFARDAIKMTRFAYGLDQIETRSVEPTQAPSATEVSASKATLDNMRLWDPAVLQTSFEALQGIRPYYSFYDVDIDRYPIGGKSTMLMLGARHMDIDGLNPNAKNWTNQRLRYTHGYGVVVSRVDQSTPDGQPVLLAQDIPQRSDPQLGLKEPRIYFGDGRDKFGMPIDDYCVVNTGEAEFDFPTADNSASHRWTGDRGIPLGFLTRLAFSTVLGDGNLLVSPKVSGESRLLVNRNIINRAQKIYPFLKFDLDPYLVLIDGRAVWVLDGYTTSEMLPYSAHVGEGPNRLNYIRNSVKVSIDAYSGETTAYAIDAKDPVLRAYRKIYPKLISDFSEMPKDLVTHLRYPEDLLRVQGILLCTYHVTDPSVFLSNGDAWDLAHQRGANGAKESIRPFYVEMKLPDEPGTGFLQILPFTPTAKPNMSGWLGAHCDPDQYGKLALYRLDQGRPVAGPEQIEGKFAATPDISNINRQFQNDQSRIIVGNLLVVPIGKSFLYAESLFLQSKTPGLQSAPRLIKVILGLNNQVVVADTYPQALSLLFGAGSTTTPVEPPSAPMSPNDQRAANVSVQAVRQALEMLNEADSALRAGDFAKYGDLQNRAKAKLRALAGDAPKG